MEGQGSGGKGAQREAPSPNRKGEQPGRATTGQDRMDRGGQSQPRTSEDQDRGRGQMERNQRGQTEMNRERDQPRSGERDTKRDSTTTRRDSTTTSTSTSLNTEQRTKIRETVLRGGSVNRVSKVDFSISVGTVVPRSVRLVTVPSTIVEIHPAWRGYLYVVVEDEIIIVEPGTLKIVAVIA
jgi:hypothetical protein